MTDSGLSKLKRQLEELIVKTLNVPDQNPELEQLFNKGFMADNTNFSDLDNFLENSPTELRQMDSCEDLLCDELEDFIRTETDFGSWQAMRQEAEVQWMNTHLRD